MLAIAAFIIGMTAQYNYVEPGIGEGFSYFYAQQVDITSDDSITRYVGPNDPLNFLQYKPTDLVPVREAAFVWVQ